jgi:carbon-monoxide dehydrogenase small subunit
MAGTVPIHFVVNGRERAVDVTPNHTLLDVLRNDLRLTGTKECCLVGECGACTVLFDGESVDSCLVLAAEADGAAITTVEGLAASGLHPLQQSFIDTGAVQCGFCIPGQLVAATARLARLPHPDRAQIEEGLAGNLCRCAGYEQIIEAVVAAAADGAGSTADRVAPEATPVVGDRASTPDASLAPQ